MRVQFVLQCVLAVAVCVLVFTAGIQAEPKSQTGARADWPNWRGPTHDGISKETGWGANWPQGGPKVLWRASLGTGFCSFAVSGGRVYTAKGHDIVYCFDADTGKLIVMIDGGKLLTAEASPEGFKKISEAKILNRKCWTVAVLAGGRIYARNAFGQMVCLDVSKGS